MVIDFTLQSFSSSNPSSYLFYLNSVFIDLFRPKKIKSTLSLEDIHPSGPDLFHLKKSSVEDRDSR